MRQVPFGGGTDLIKVAGAVTYRRVLSVTAPVEEMFCFLTHRLHQAFRQKAWQEKGPRRALRWEGRVTSGADWQGRWCCPVSVRPGDRMMIAAFVPSGSVPFGHRLIYVLITLCSSCERGRDADRRCNALGERLSPAAGRRTASVWLVPVPEFRVPRYLSARTHSDR